MAYVELGLEVKAAVSENKGVRAMNKETLTVIWGEATSTSGIS